MFQIGVITLFPEMFSCLQFGITGKAIQNKLVRVDCWNPRDWARTPHRQVDDKPYGGGPGMVMMYEPLEAAIQHAATQLPAGFKTVYLSPQGKIVHQIQLNRMVETKQPLLLIAGRYEGIDERIISKYVHEEWSLGDFVLSGGEMAAMVFIDAMIRQLPGALGHHQSAQQDSFMNGLLDYPHYTRPAEIQGMLVPPVLLGGNHQAIEQWRKQQALGQTWLKRPDLLDKLQLDSSDQKLLNEFILRSVSRH